MKKHICIALLALILAVSLVACDSNHNNTPNESDSGSTAGTNESGNGNATGVESGDGLIMDTQPESTDNGSGETDATDTTPSNPTAQTITLTFNGNRITASDASGKAINSASFMTVDGNALIINQPGSYELKGDLSNGQIRVAIDKTADIELIFNNFTVSNSVSAPVYIQSANEAVIILADGSVNTLTDGTDQYQLAAGETKPNACLYSSDDLVIKGNGTLNVTALFNNGIGCKNDLRIKSGTINVTAPNNILKGNDSVEIEDATLTLRGGEDAIKADTETKEGKGYVLITAGARIDIQCIDDAIQAFSSITVEPGATITGQAGGDTFNCPGAITADGADIQLTSATQPA